MPEGQGLIHLHEFGRRARLKVKYKDKKIRKKMPEHGQNRKLYMMKNLLSAVSLLAALSIASAVDQVEVVGGINHWGVKSPACVWLNGDPIAILSNRQSYPRISNSFPIRKGTNQLIVRSLNDKGLENGGVGPTFFFKSGENEVELMMNYDVGKSTYNTTFEAERSYGVGDGKPKLATEETVNLAKNWVGGFLAELAAKDRKGVSQLFFENKNAEGFYLHFLKPEMQFKTSIEPLKYRCQRGMSIVLVFGDGKLAEWQVGDINHYFNDFMFCNTDQGVFLRLSGGLWVKCRDPKAPQ